MKTKRTTPRYTVVCYNGSGDGLIETPCSSLKAAKLTAALASGLKRGQRATFDWCRSAAVFLGSATGDPVAIYDSMRRSPR